VTIQVDPDSTGKIVDTATVGGNERVIEVIGDPTVAAAKASVLNAAPVAEYGLVVRNIPSGVQPVSGTFWQGTQPVSIAGTVAVSGPLTDAQLRAAAVPVSGTFFQATQPVSSTQLPAALAANGGLKIEGVASGVAVPVSGTFFQATQPVSIAGTVAVSGPLTDTQLRASAVPVSGTFFQATQPVSIAGTVAVSNTQLPAALGQGTMAQSMKVVLASDQSTLPANAEMRGSTLHVTGTAAVNTGVTVTLPAAGAGLFHYITSIQIVKLYSVVGVAAGAGVIITSTNLPGNPAWTTEQLASPAGTAPVVLNYQPTTPLKSSVANTATTIVCPVQLQTIWRVNVTYFTGA
jgi:hypothetical protein